MTKSQDRTKLLLLIGILLFGGISIYLHLELKAQREAAEDARENDPINRAKQAVQDADRATINGELPKARVYLAKARQAITEAIKREPADPKLAHSQLVIVRRQLHVAEQSKAWDDARTAARDALKYAQQIFQGNRTQSQARFDILSTARELSTVKGIDPKEALHAMEDAAQKVDESVRSVQSNSAVRILLAKTWMYVAQKKAQTLEHSKAMQAAQRALELMRKIDDNTDAIQGLSTTYILATMAVDIAEKLQHATEQETFEKLAVDTMTARVELEPLNLGLVQVLASRMNKWADLVLKRGDEKAALTIKEQATSLIRKAHTRHPNDQKLRWTLTRLLNELGALHSSKNRDQKALKAYGDAHAIALDLLPDAARTRLLTMGNYAQLLGRLDKINEARTISKMAYDYARTISDTKGSAQSIEDLANAELRYARLLRARPNAKAQMARQIARVAHKRLKGQKTQLTKRGKRIAKGLSDLLRELQ